MDPVTEMAVLTTSGWRLCLNSFRSVLLNFPEGNSSVNDFLSMPSLRSLSNIMSPCVIVTIFLVAPVIASNAKNSRSFMAAYRLRFLGTTFSLFLTSCAGSFSAASSATRAIYTARPRVIVPASHSSPYKLLPASSINLPATTLIPKRDTLDSHRWLISMSCILGPPLVMFRVRSIQNPSCRVAPAFARASRMGPALRHPLSKATKSSSGRSSNAFSTVWAPTAWTRTVSALVAASLTMLYRSSLGLISDSYMAQPILLAAEAEDHKSERCTFLPSRSASSVMRRHFAAKRLNPVALVTGDGSNSHETSSSAISSNTVDVASERSILWNIQALMMPSAPNPNAATSPQFSMIALASLRCASGTYKLDEKFQSRSPLSFARAVMRPLTSFVASFATATDLQPGPRERAADTLDREFEPFRISSMAVIINLVVVPSACVAPCNSLPSRYTVAMACSGYFSCIA
mmetsp:Transcript_1838/g.5560  ORF Transcript_1838/g.5560 Transcript_1838/m.5560 type:complete len:461 (+) Transcript_1838:1894-3276(+)